MDRIYEKIYIIGQGAPPLACARLLKKRSIPATFFVTGGPLANFTQKVARGMGVAFEPITGEDLPSIFDENQRALVLSVNNSLIFPRRIVEMENLRVINYHNSLLPAHRGMHAEAWTIFDGDPLAGISWHVVDSGIDTGPLIAQRAVQPQNLTSLELLKRQCDAAMVALSVSLEDILAGTIPLNPQPPCTTPAHKRGELPNNGVLDLAWPAKKIWNFLRAFDYGALEILGKPRCWLKDSWYTWKTYCPLGEMGVGPEDFPIPSAGLVLKSISPLPAEGGES